MRNSRSRCSFGHAAAAMLAAGCLLHFAPPAAHAQSRVILHSFTGPDGIEPNASLAFGPDDLLYGTTTTGGLGHGVVFRQRRGTGGFKVVHQLAGGAGGRLPFAPVVFGPDGAMFGTTRDGGNSNRGTVFQLLPRGGAAARAGFRHRILHHFTDASGAEPFTGLTLGPDGKLYGTASTGGGNAAAGTVFQLAQREGRNSYKYTVLHAFDANANLGHTPRGRLLLGQDGSLYGTTITGGATSNGVVFRLIPPPPDQRRWKYEVLHQFDGPTGSSPLAGVTFGPDGALYGTTSSGGTNACFSSGCGTVFKLAPPPAGPDAIPWVHTVLHHFTGQPAGQMPIADVIVDVRGAVFGTTLFGGACCGTVFRLVPRAGGTYEFQVVIPFAGGDDGNMPAAGLVADERGVLYGTTRTGGLHPQRRGTVFKVHGSGFRTLTP